jgi:methyltransferase
METRPLFVLAVIVGLMLAEARVSRRHEKRLRARGAVEPNGDAYRAMAIAYPACFLAMGLEGILRQTEPEGFFLSGALMFIVSKWLKYWAIGALGERWSFRVLVVPGEPLVTHGPYRYVAHPNYIAVVGELAGTAMMMGATVSGPLALVMFGAILWRRVRLETAALGKAYERP